MHANEHMEKHTNASQRTQTHRQRHKHTHTPRDTKKERKQKSRHKRNEEPATERRRNKESAKERKEKKSPHSYTRMLAGHGWKAAEQRNSSRVGLRGAPMAEGAFPLAPGEEGPSWKRTARDSICLVGMV